MCHSITLHPSLHYLQENLYCFRMPCRIRHSWDCDRQHVRSYFPVPSTILRLGQVDRRRDLYRYHPVDSVYSHSERGHRSCDARHAASDCVEIECKCLGQDSSDSYLFARHYVSLEATNVS